MKEEVKQKLAFYGKYNEVENCLYLYDNDYLHNETLMEILKRNNIKIQLELFS